MRCKGVVSRKGYRQMITTGDLLLTAKYLVARHGAAAALAFAARGLQAMTLSRQNQLIADWAALHSLIEDAANGRLAEKAPAIH